MGAGGAGFDGDFQLGDHAVTVGKGLGRIIKGNMNIALGAGQGVDSDFQLGGGGLHALGHFGEYGAQVVADQFGLPGNAGIDGDVVLFVHRSDDIGDTLFHRFRGDAVGGIVGLLFFAAPVGFGNGVVQRSGHLVGIQNDAAVDVAGGAADGLHQRGLGSQKAFLVGVEDGDQGAFGNIQPLAQQVDADQHVEGAQAQVAQDRGVAFLELRQPGPDGTFGSTDVPKQDALIRSIYKGPLVLNSDYTPEEAAKDVESGRADAISFGRPFISNPDLPVRIAKGAALAENVDVPKSWYLPGAEGYIDYPTLEEEQASAA